MGNSASCRTAASVYWLSFQTIMPLSLGTRLGPYSVTAKIGEGGMGEDLAERWEKRDGTAGAPRAVDVQSRPPAVRPPAEHF